MRGAFTEALYKRVTLFSSLGDIVVISKADERHHLELLGHSQEMSITDVITGIKNLEQKHLCWNTVFSLPLPDAFMITYALTNTYVATQKILCLSNMELLLSLIIPVVLHSGSQQDFSTMDSSYILSLLMTKERNKSHFSDTYT